MPFIKVKQPNMTSIAEAARLCGIKPQPFWEYVKEQHIIPEPKTPMGHRFAYSPKELENVIKVVATLKREGRIK